VFRTNVDGVLNTVLPAIERLRARPPGHKKLGARGQIAIIASLSAFRGMPGSPAYSASKAAVKAWGEALAIRLKREGIAVSVICPGFVDTALTRRNPFRMPMLMTAAKAAGVIRRRLKRGDRRIAFPLPMYLGAWFLAVLPPFIADRILARLPTKSEN
jgi:NAD(P)-dependent dehydrogenase (short-subunit alcohol dehydrogenase family)